MQKKYLRNLGICKCGSEDFGQYYTMHRHRCPGHRVCTESTLASMWITFFQPREAIPLGPWGLKIELDGTHQAPRID
ncbi:hypothetical protein QQP08_015128 [Theobroma cacao]|nr:hypothetical protein QQP08_015128 [Theobroma cacao]